MADGHTTSNHQIKVHVGGVHSSLIAILRRQDTKPAKTYMKQHQQTTRAVKPTSTTTKHVSIVLFLAANNSNSTSRHHSRSSSQLSRAVCQCCCCGIYPPSVCSCQISSAVAERPRADFVSAGCSRVAAARRATTTNNNNPKANMDTLPLIACWPPAGRCHTSNYQLPKLQINAVSYLVRLQSSNPCFRHMTGAGPTMPQPPAQPPAQSASTSQLLNKTKTKLLC